MCPASGRVSYRSGGGHPGGGGRALPGTGDEGAIQRASTLRTVTVVPRWTVRQGEGAEFVVPTGLAYSDTGDLYVSDNNAHMVHVGREGSATAGELPAGAAAARLRFPGSVRAWGGKIFVSDNAGIKVLSSDGSFERLLRLYTGHLRFRGHAPGHRCRQPHRQGPHADGSTGRGGGSDREGDKEIRRASRDGGAG